MSTVLKKVEAWPCSFGGMNHSGWLPSDATSPKPTPIEHELLDVQIESMEGGFLLIWSVRSQERHPPKAGDTWHETLEDAENAAQEYFGIENEHWTNITPAA